MVTDGQSEWAKRVRASITTCRAGSRIGDQPTSRCCPPWSRRGDQRRRCRQRRSLDRTAAARSCWRPRTADLAGSAHPSRVSRRTPDQRVTSGQCIPLVAGIIGVWPVEVRLARPDYIYCLTAKSKRRFLKACLECFLFVGFQRCCCNLSLPHLPRTTKSGSAPNRLND